MRRDMDLRYVVLLALYSEYLNEEGDFSRVKSSDIDCTPAAFCWALMRLQTEGMIGGCVFQPPHAQSAAKIRGVLRDEMYLTREGVETCDRLLGVNSEDRDRHKLKVLGTLLTEIGAPLVAAMIERALGI